MDGGNILHVIPPPPNFYQSRRVYWGNPYATANSDDNSNPCGNVPIFVDMRAAAIDVSAFVADVSAAVAGVSAASINVSAAAIDLCPSNADKCTTVPGVSAVDVKASDAAVYMSSDAVN